MKRYIIADDVRSARLSERHGRGGRSGGGAQAQAGELPFGIARVERVGEGVVFAKY